MTILKNQLIFGTCLGMKVPLEVYQKTIVRRSISPDLHFFSKKCEEGCRNYDKKWCCPPHTVSFEKISPNQRFIHLVFIRTEVRSIPAKQLYQKIRVGNAILTSRLRQILEFAKRSQPSTTIFGSGSCKACRPCELQNGKPCKRPEKKLNSLESVGVNCQNLVKNSFGFDLEWYRKGEQLNYTAVIGGFFLDTPQLSKNFQTSLENFIEEM